MDNDRPRGSAHRYLERILGTQADFGAQGGTVRGDAFSQPGRLVRVGESGVAAVQCQRYGRQGDSSVGVDGDQEEQPEVVA
jgi:hypothetical protein